MYDGSILVHWAWGDQEMRFINNFRLFQINIYFLNWTLFEFLNEVNFFFAPPGENAPLLQRSLHRNFFSRSRKILFLEQWNAKMSSLVITRVACAAVTLIGIIVKSEIPSGHFGLIFLSFRLPHASFGHQFVVLLKALLTNRCFWLPKANQQLCYIT